MSNTTMVGAASSGESRGGRADDDDEEGCENDDRGGESGGIGDNGESAALVAPENALATAVAQVTMRRVGSVLSGSR